MISWGQLILWLLLWSVTFLVSECDSCTYVICNMIRTKKHKGIFIIITLGSEGESLDNTRCYRLFFMRDSSVFLLTAKILSFNKLYFFSHFIFGVLFLIFTQKNQVFSSDRHFISRLPFSDTYFFLRWISSFFLCFLLSHTSSLVA